MSYEDFYKKNLGKLPGLINLSNFVNIDGADNEPSLLDMAKNFKKSTINWIKSGFKIVSKNQFNKRLKICRKCEKWDEDVRLGLGKCKAQGCGCTKLKLWLQSENCPLHKWN